MLDCFTAESPELGLSEIAARLEMPLSTAHRLLGALETLGYVAKDANSGKYRLGLKVVVAAGLALSASELYRQALPHMRTLVSLTGLNANLGVLYQGQVLYLARLFNPAVSISGSSVIGRTAPPHSCAVGKVLLAHLSRQEAEALLRARPLVAYTAATITDANALLGTLGQVRERGYALDEGELTPGFHCVAAPVRGRDGRVIAALSATGPAEVVARRPLEELVRLVCDYAGRLSYNLGYDIALA